MVDDVHEFGSSLRPDVARGFLHVFNVFLLTARVISIVSGVHLYLDCFPACMAPSSDYTESCTQY